VALIAANGIKSAEYIDTEMSDGYFRVEGEPAPITSRRRIFMNLETRGALAWAGKKGAVLDHAATLPEGTYLIPARLLQPEAAREVEMSLDLLKELVGESPDCAMPHCLQPTASAHRGFSLCAEHGALLDEWDTLSDGSPA
jgi:hypothetical protein